jgi:hypothetical protein
MACVLRNLHIPFHYLLAKRDFAEGKKWLEEKRNATFLAMGSTHGPENYFPLLLLPL